MASPYDPRQAAAAAAGAPTSTPVYDPRKGTGTAPQKTAMYDPRTEKPGGVPTQPGKPYAGSIDQQLSKANADMTAQSGMALKPEHAGETAATGAGMLGQTAMDVLPFATGIGAEALLLKSIQTTAATIANPWLRKIYEAGATSFASTVGYAGGDAARIAADTEVSLKTSEDVNKWLEDQAKGLGLSFAMAGTGALLTGSAHRAHRFGQRLRVGTANDEAVRTADRVGRRMRNAVPDTTRATMRGVGKTHRQWRQDVAALEATADNPISGAHAVSSEWQGYWYNAFGAALGGGPIREAEQSRLRAVGAYSQAIPRRFIGHLRQMDPQAATKLIADALKHDDTSFSAAIGAGRTHVRERVGHHLVETKSLSQSARALLRNYSSAGISDAAPKAARIAENVGNLDPRVLEYAEYLVMERARKNPRLMAKISGETLDRVTGKPIGKEAGEAFKMRLVAKEADNWATIDNIIEARKQAYTLAANKGGYDSSGRPWQGNDASHEAQNFSRVLKSYLRDGTGSAKGTGFLAPVDNPKAVEQLETGYPALADVWDFTDAATVTRAKTLGGGRVGEDNHWADAMLELSANPGGSAQDLTSVLSSTPRDEAAFALMDAIEYAPIDQITKYNKNMDQATLTSAFSTVPAMLDSLGRGLPNNQRAIAQGYARYQFVQDLVNNATGEVGGISTLHPVLFKQELERVGKARFEYVTRQPGLWDELMDLMNYQQNAMERPVGRAGAESFQFRTAKAFQNVGGGAGGAAAGIAFGQPASIPAAVSAIAYGSTVLAMPVGAARILSSRTHVDRLLNIAQNLEDPQRMQTLAAKWETWGAAGGAVTGTSLAPIVIDALTDVTHMDDNGKVHREKPKKVQQSGPPLPMERR